MARAEENIRRFNPVHLNTVSIDHFDGSDLGSAALYDLSSYNIASLTCSEDLSSSIIIAPASFKSPKKFKPERLSTGRTFNCQNCTSTFRNASNLKSHMRIHTGEKPFKCDECKRSFVQNSNLKAHKRTHTGEKPFKCHLCGKAFARSSHLVGHKRIHTGETPYSCAICFKAFATSNQLRKHCDSKHDANNHVCSYCEKIFSTKESLAIHFHIHSKERPYVCVLCTAAFRSREDLNVHKKLHPGDEYPYSCKVCGKGFKIKLCCEKHAEKCRLQTPPPPPPPQRNGVAGKHDWNPFDIFTNSDLDFADLGTFANGQSQVFQFDDSQGPNGVMKVEMLENCIEDGIEFEVDEQMLVLTNEGENSVIQVIPSSDSSGLCH